jgi:hypothetical protein
MRSGENVSGAEDEAISGFCAGHQVWRRWSENFWQIPYKAECFADAVGDASAMPQMLGLDVLLSGRRKNAKL